MALCRSLCGKAQFLRELHVRAGFGSVTTLLNDPFNFRSDDFIDGAPGWKNIEQLEAVVEFYTNFRPKPAPDKFGDPWAVNPAGDSTAAPLDDDDAEYINVNLG